MLNVQKKHTFCPDSIIDNAINKLFASKYDENSLFIRFTLILIYNHSNFYYSY